MKKLFTLLIIVALFGCSNQKKTEQAFTLLDFPIDEPASYSGIVSGINTTGFNVGDTLYYSILGSIDSTQWVSIDTVYGDTLLTIDNSNHFYRWYKVQFVGDGGPMVIHGVWVNHKDSTVTKFTITE